MTGVTTGTTNYGIITAASFSTNTTLTVQVAEGDTIPTSGGVSAISYSTQKAPYGFPGQTNKWSVEMVSIAATDNGSTSAVINIKRNILIPVGSWNVMWRLPLTLVTATSTTHNSRFDLNETTAVVTTSSQFHVASTYVNIQEEYPHLTASGKLDLSSAATYYFNMQPVGATYTAYGIGSYYGIIRAELALL